MGKRDSRVDAYIAKSADFARPILEHLRELVHEACPKVEETIKWGSPHFMYEGNLAGMAAFKEHCVFGFWKGALVFDDPERAQSGMGQFGKIRSLGDLPSARQMKAYVKKAAALNELGEKAPKRPPKHPRKPIGMPDDFAAALKKHSKAAQTFENFTPSHRREYLEWITEAKREETRQKRIATAIEWLSEGKQRHWKYQRA